MKNKNLNGYFLLIATLVIVDQLIKSWTVKTLAQNQSLEIIPSLFRMTYIKNPGAAFGTFSSNKLVTVALPILITIAMVYYLSISKNKLLKISLSLLVGGSIGNLIDRIRLGYVVDMFDFYGIWKYVFNFADISVVLGSALLLLYGLSTNYD